MSEKMTAAQALDRLHESLEDAHQLSMWRLDKLQHIRAELESLRRDAEALKRIKAIGWRKVSMCPTSHHCVGWNDCREAIDAALEADNG